MEDLEDCVSVKREVKYDNSKDRMDLLVTTPEECDIAVEVKSVTEERDGVGYFPDARTRRGAEHAERLRNFRASSDSRGAMFVFCALNDKITERVVIDGRVDPAFVDKLISTAVETRGLAVRFRVKDSVIVPKFSPLFVSVAPRVTNSAA